MADVKAEAKSPRQLLEEAQKAKADATAKETALLKDLRESDLLTVKKLIAEHGFLQKDLVPELQTRSVAAKAAAKKVTPRKSTPRKKAK